MRGQAGKAGEVILRGNPIHPVVNCVPVDSTASLIGFTLTGGRVGVVGVGSTVNIINCIIEENHLLSDMGSGAACTGTTPHPPSPTA